MEVVDLIKEKRIRLGKVLRAIRKALGKTLEEIASQADLDAGNLSRIERGLQGVADDTMELIAKALGVSVSQIHAISEQFLSDAQLKRKAEELIAGQGQVRVGEKAEVEPLPSISDLLPKASPKTYADLMAIAKAAESGRLSEEDIALLRAIAKRLEEKPSAKGEPER